LCQASSWTRTSSFAGYAIAGLECEGIDHLLWVLPAVAASAEQPTEVDATDRAAATDRAEEDEDDAQGSDREE
jgi:hypothetical protein